MCTSTMDDLMMILFACQVYISKGDEEMESRTKLVDGLKTALRTQPLRYSKPKIAHLVSFSIV